MTVLQMAIKLMLYIAVGFAARKMKILADGFDKMLTRFLMAVPLPCMIINTFKLDFSLEQLMNCPRLIGLSALSLIVCFILGQIVYMAMGKGGLGKAARFSLIFTNFTFFGFSVVSELYGNEASFYYVIFTLLIRIFFYGAAPILVGAGGEHFDLKQAAKQFISVPVVAVFIGLFLYITQLQLPEIISSVMTSFGNMASPLGLMLCGIIIADASFKGILKYPCVLWLTALRLLLVPGVMLGIFLLLGIDHEIIRSLHYYFAMPCATFLPTFFLRYNPDDTEARSMASFLVVCSTLCCVVTIPLWAMVMEHIL